MIQSLSGIWGQTGVDFSHGLGIQHQMGQDLSGLHCAAGGWIEAPQFGNDPQVTQIVVLKCLQECLHAQSCVRGPDRLIRTR